MKLTYCSSWDGHRGLQFGTDDWRYAIVIGFGKRPRIWRPGNEPTLFQRRKP